MSWETPEYFYHEKSADWHWWVGLFAALLFGLAIWQRSFLFGVLVAIAWFTITLYAIRPPRTINIALTERGVLVENKLYLWPELRSFWVFYNPPLQQEISLESQKTIMPYIKIPLGENIDIAKTRELIKKFLPEVEQQESLIDNLSRLAKF